MCFTFIKVTEEYKKMRKRCFTGFEGTLELDVFYHFIKDNVPQKNIFLYF
jgi:hypothetical protein